MPTILRKLRQNLFRNRLGAQKPVLESATNFRNFFLNFLQSAESEQEYAPLKIPAQNLGPKPGICSPNSAVFKEKKI
jgi:hypothetical protein